MVKQYTLLDFFIDISQHKILPEEAEEILKANLPKELNLTKKLNADDNGRFQEGYNHCLWELNFRIDNLYDKSMVEFIKRGKT